MGLEEFWHSTPGEISTYLEAASLRAADRIDVAKVAAYCVEVMARQDKKKKLMPLNKWLERKGAIEAQSPEQQIAMMRMFVAASAGMKKAKRG